MTARLILGIDPGLAGALCWMDATTGEALDVADLPVIAEGKKKSIDAPELARLLTRHGQPHRAYIEMVGARPTDSRTGAFTFGRNLGAIEALVVLSHLIIFQTISQEKPGA